MARIECPECGRPADDQDFACSHCELILNPNAPGGRYVMTQPSIVRALISPANFSSQRDEAPPKPPERDPFDDVPTTAAQVMLTGDEVPHVVARLDVELSEFEAYVVSFCDGETTTAEVAVAASLQMVELNAIVNSLVSRKILTVPGARSLSFRDLPAQPAPPPPPEVDDDDDLEPEPTTPNAISYFAGMDAEPELTSEGPAARGTPSSPSWPTVRPPPPPAEARPPPFPVAPSRPPTSTGVPQVAAPAPAQRPASSR